MSDRPLPSSIPRPPYDFSTGKPLVTLDATHINSAAEVAGMEAAGRLARSVLASAAASVVPGMTTLDIDRIVHDKVVEGGAYPSPLGYQAFPRSVCTSVNNVICHGIPDERALVDGDIVNIDVTVYLNGFHGDTSCTVLVGDVDEAGKTLVAATQESLDEALSVCGPGVPFSAIGDAVHKVAQAHKFSINKDFCGHGIGRQFHQPPLVLHYPNSAKDVMQVGMTFTVEPILCQGGAEYVRWPDNWTIVTQDGGRSAQFEHTVLVVEDGIRILT
ncbi:peptidase M24, structural domain-containing protein [Entophlyctis helioformis]|nr:peptidase M24, structural domain-containing protein [Entophlyctis helioformis]